jgi:hypothetical protein
MSSLYQLDNEWAELQRMIEAGDTTEEEMADHLEAMDIEFSQKAHAIGCVIKNMQAETDVIHAEMARLDERADNLLGQRLQLSGYLLKSMQARGEKSVKTPLFTFSYRKPSQVAVIDDDSLLSDEFYINVPATRRVDKKTLLKALKESTIEIEGAHLGEGNINLQIK